VASHVPAPRGEVIATARADQPGAVPIGTGATGNRIVNPETMVGDPRRDLGRTHANGAAGR
jgi:hypothetical protein